MNRSIAARVPGLAASVLTAFGLAAVAAAAMPRPAAAQLPPECQAFMQLRDAAGQKAGLVRDANKRGADRKELCTLVTSFAAAETTMVKFLEDNKTWCGIPDQAVVAAKTNHEKTLKFRTVACSEAGAPGRPKAPSLSDAIGGGTVDSSSNTKTGPGTFDTLTGNPLAR
jgi:hypothetical protein